MEKPSYEELIEGFATHRYEEVVFSLPEYGHYRKCVIRWRYDDIPTLGMKAPRDVEVRLSSKEVCYFAKGNVNGHLVVFHIQGKRKFDLVEAWGKAEICSIVLGDK